MGVSWFSLLAGEIISGEYGIGYLPGTPIQSFTIPTSLPNYVTVFDWPHNIATIIRSTQSAQDMVSIILDEWILEFGYMNHDFGHGISEWSLVILPAKLLFVLVWAALLATDVVLICRAYRSCDAAALAGGIAATTAGALIAGVTSVTMTWVVCCATPSWVVGLTVLGGGVSTALAMQPIGAWLAFSALAALLSVTLGLAVRLGRHPADPDRLRRIAAVARTIGEQSCPPA
jgi:hypothetical protein